MENIIILILSKGFLKNKNALFNFIHSKVLRTHGRALVVLLLAANDDLLRFYRPHQIEKMCVTYYTLPTLFLPPHWQDHFMTRPVMVLHSHSLHIAFSIQSESLEITFLVFFCLWAVQKLNSGLSKYILKGHITKFYSIQGGGLKNLSGVFTGEGMPRFKKFGCFENRRVWQF